MPLSAQNHDNSITAQAIFRAAGFSGKTSLGAHFYTVLDRVRCAEMHGENDDHTCPQTSASLFIPGTGQPFRPKGHALPLLQEVVSLK